MEANPINYQKIEKGSLWDKISLDKGLKESIYDASSELNEEDKYPIMRKKNSPKFKLLFQSMDN